MQKLNIIMLFIIFIVGCIKDPTSSNKSVKNDSFEDRKRTLSFEKVMKALPNIMDIRDTVELVVVGKFIESEVDGISMVIHENPGNRVIYKGSLMGIMLLPRNRIRVPISSRSHELFATFSNRDGDTIYSPLKILDSREAVIRASDFNISSFKK